MGTPYMSTPKEGERLAADWVSAATGAPPAPFQLGREVSKELAHMWRRPDPDWEHPYPGEEVECGWLHRGTKDRPWYIIEDNSAWNVVHEPSLWLKPRARPEPAPAPKPRDSTHSRELQIFMRSAHEPGAPRAVWPTFDD